MNILKRNKVFLLNSLLISLLFAISFMFDGLRFGADTTFHINRIEGLYNAINNGIYYPRIFSLQNYEYGYGSPLFYSIFFLYLPVLFRLLNISPVISYKLFIIICTFISSFMMSKLLDKFINKRIIIFISSSLNIINNYYFSDAYYRGALGEILAFIFIPITILGIYELLFEDNKIHNLIIGFCGLLLSHNISFILLCFLFLVLLIINYKKLNLTINKNILLSIIISLLLTAFFLFPMLEQLNLGIYRISTYFNKEILTQDIFNLLSIKMYDVYNSESCGYLLLILGIIYLFLKQKDSFITKILIIAYTLIIISSNIFPWQIFSFLSFIQWSSRLMIIVIPLLSIVSAYTLDKINNYHFNILIIILTIIYASYLHISIIKMSGDIKNNDSPKMLSNYDHYFGLGKSDQRNYWYNPNEISSPEYLIDGGAINFHKEKRTIKKDNNEVIEISLNKYNYLSFKIKENGNYLIPFSYYKGYTAQLFKDGEYIKTYKASLDEETGLLLFNFDDLNDNYDVIVSYQETKIQKISMFISIISLLFIIILKIYKRYIKG